MAADTAPRVVVQGIDLTGLGYDLGTSVQSVRHELVDYLIDNHYRAHSRPLRRCHPRARASLDGAPVARAGLGDRPGQLTGTFVARLFLRLVGIVPLVESGPQRLTMG